MLTDGSDVLVRLELPGIDIDNDVEVEVHDGRLTVTGQRQSQVSEESQNQKILVREHRYGSFRREFALPAAVTGDDVTADYDQGILEIRIREVTQPEPRPQRVEVHKKSESRPRPVIEGSVSD